MGETLSRQARMTKRISLSGKRGAGKFALVDDADYEVLSKYLWRLSNGYPTTSIRSTRMHRFLMNPPAGLVVDHINGDRLDNRRSNLRVCTHRDNLRNRVTRRDNESGFKGVSRVRPGGRWKARIRIDERCLHLGVFDTPLEAARCYNEAAQLHYGEFANLNHLD